MQEEGGLSGEIQVRGRGTCSAPRWSTGLCAQAEHSPFHSSYCNTRTYSCVARLVHDWYIRGPTSGGLTPPCPPGDRGLYATFDAVPS